MLATHRRLLVIGFPAMGILSGLWLQGTFLHGVLLSLALVTAATVGLVLGLWAAYRLRKGDLPARFGDVARFFGLLLLSGLLSFAIGAGIHQYYHQQTRSFVERVVPELDAFKAHHGVYPKTLQEIGVNDLPLYLRGSGGYDSDGETFEFMYLDKSRLFDFYIFDSKSRQWIDGD